MSEAIEIHWTAASLDEARRVCRFLVQERHIACAQVIPWVESIYMWDNQLETTQESKIVMKTKKEKFHAVREVIESNSSYEVPEITWRTIEGGNQAYMDWLGESILLS